MKFRLNFSPRYVPLGAGRGLELRSRSPSRPQNPTHPPTTLYKGRATLALNFIIVPHALISKFHIAKIVKFQLHYKSALYFAKIPIKF